MDCDWKRLWPPRGVRKCYRLAVVVRDGYGGGRNVRFCEEHDPLMAPASPEPGTGGTPTA